MVFERLAQADCLHVFIDDGRRPECVAYWARLQSRPSYRQAILDHAHEAIVAGTRRLGEAKAEDPTLRAVLEGS